MLKFGITLLYSTFVQFILIYIYYDFRWQINFNEFHRVVSDTPIGSIPIGLWIIIFLELLLSFLLIRKGYSEFKSTE